MNGRSKEGGSVVEKGKNQTAVGAMVKMSVGASNSAQRTDRDLSIHEINLGGKEPGFKCVSR